MCNALRVRKSLGDWCGFQRCVFDLVASDAVFQSQGEEEYRKYQQENLNVPLPKGIAYPFIKRLLSVNDLSADPTDPLVEVILLSRNDPDTGLRVLKTIEHYGLGMTRAIFMQGKSPYEYIPALNIALFLSGEKKDVEGAIKAGYPAGQVLDSKFEDDETDRTLRIAFDFDGVLAGDESESMSVHIPFGITNNVVAQVEVAPEVGQGEEAV